MKWFGDKPFGRVCQDIERVLTPVGEQCDWCEEQIVFGEEGLLIPSVGKDSVFHRCCFLRQITGSVGHQLGKCGCHGGNEEDPEGMTKKQAAEAAAELFESKLRRG